MKFSNYKEQVPGDFSSSSRVWVYQSNRAFTDDEARATELVLNDFVNGWKSHGAPVKGYAKLFFNRFIIFMADESAVAVGGCSADSSVQVMRETGQRFDMDLFNRQLLAFVINDAIQLIALNELEKAIAENQVSDSTLYFNNTILTKQELEDRWLIPAGESWLAGRYNIPAGILQH